MTAIAILLAGCGETTAAPSATVPGSIAPGPLGPPGTSTCREIDLRLSNGDPLDLTGTWLGDDASYWTFTQLDDCVWATATDQYGPSDGSFTYWQIYLRGTLAHDFTISVEYAYSPYADGASAAHYGHAVLSIEFLDADGAMTLRKTAGCDAGEGTAPCPAGEGTLQTTVWTPVSSRVILPAPTPEP